MPENLPAIVGEFGIVMVPTSRRRRPGETHAKAKLRDILLQHGENHLRLVLRLIRGTAPNREALWSEIFEALSDVLVAFPAWKEREPELHFALDGICLQKAREKAVSLRPWPVRGSLRVLLWIALERLLKDAQWVIENKADGYWKSEMEQAPSASNRNTSVNVFKESR